MQNTARLPIIPNTLIKNFFIAGVDQQTLAEKINEGNAFKIQPEVLFSMYSKNDLIKSYLSFVFPEKIAVEYAAQDPRFYSFMSTDEKGFNCFFHVLHFYEEINEAEIQAGDFDIVADMLRQQNLRQRGRKQGQTLKTKKEQSLKKVNDLVDPKYQNAGNKIEVNAKLTGVAAGAKQSTTKTPATDIDPYQQSQFPNVREGSTGEIANKNSKLEDNSKIAEEGDLFNQTRGKRRVLVDKKKKNKCLNACQLAAMITSTDQEEPKTPPGKSSADKLFKQHTQDVRRQEVQRKIEAEKKSKMENVMQKIQLFSQASAFNVSGIRSGEQSLNQTLNMNLQISTLDPQNKLQQLKHRGGGNINAMNQAAYLAFSSKQGKASSYVISPKQMQDQRLPQKQKFEMRDTKMQRNYTEQDVMSALQAQENQMTGNSEGNAVGTPNLGMDLSGLPMDQSVNFGNVAMMAKANKPNDEDNYTTPFTTGGNDSGSKRNNIRYGQTQVGIRGGGILSATSSRQDLELHFSSQKTLGLLNENEIQAAVMDAEINLQLDKQVSVFPDSNKDGLNQQDNMLQYSEDDQQQHQLQELMKKKLYVPVAIVLVTETEYHDMFRQILLSLFEMIRVPESVVANRVQENKTIAFAELIAHVAFMKTIPSPPFNTVYNIYMLGQQFQIKESSFDQLPNKNQLPIKILFDVLDVKSIFYCWKALLFDKSLVIVSSQYSLQFYVAEALKQLLFPLTWQNSYIQPGNENLAGHCDGMMLCIYGSNSMVNSYDFFAALEHPEIVIVDIDAGFTNNIHLPCIPDEAMYIRILNTLKNARINQYDKAYPDTQLQEPEDFVIQVRETFFSLLKPFLSKAEEFIDKNVDPNAIYFSNYFKQDEYLGLFECYGRTYHEFAKALVESAQFQHFCDDCFDEELNNFHMLKEIYKARGETCHNDKHTSNENNSRKKSTLFDGVNLNNEDFLNCKKGKCHWPDTEPVVFNFRMPQDKQRVMLFEKLQFMIEDSLKKKERDISRKTNEDIIQNMDRLRFEEYIKLIKQVYPNKLRESRIIQDQLKQQHQYLNSSSGHINQLQNRVGGIEGGQGNHYSHLMKSSTAQKRQMKGIIDSSYTRQPHQRQQNGGQRTQFQRKGMSKHGSSDSLNVIDIDGSRSSIVEKVNRRFNQSNINNNIQNTPMGGSNQIPREPRVTSQNPYPSQIDMPRNNLNFAYQALVTPKGGGGYAQMLQNFQANQSIQMPHEIMMNSQDEMIQSFVHMSNSNHSLVVDQLEQQRIWNYSQRISRLMYGKQGLITFLHHLFGLLTEKQMKRVNYYFAINSQISKMMEVEKKINIQRKEMRMNRPIDELYEEEKSPSKYNSKTNLNNPYEQTPASQISNKDDQQDLFKRQNTNKTNKTTSAYNPTSSQLTSSTHSKFKSEKDWFSIDAWEQNCLSLKRTYQFVILRQKLYESFECPEDGYSHIWKLLIKFYPTNKMKYFPTAKFQQIWESLTASQQQEQFTRLGQKQDKPQIQMVCKYYIKQRQSVMRSTAGDSSFSFSGGGACGNSPLLPQLSRQNKSDESLFYLASVGKTYVQRKIEKKERESQLTQKLNRATSNVTEGNPFNQGCNSSREEAKQKHIDKKEKQRDQVQKKILDQLRNKMLEGKKSISTGISRNDNPDSLKVNTLSARAQTTEAFNLKGDKSQLESLSNLEKLSSSRDDKSSNKTFYGGSGSSRRDSLSKNLYQHSSTVDYDMRQTVKKSVDKVSSLKDPVQVTQRMMARIIQFWRKNSKFVRKDGNFKETELQRIQVELGYFEERYLKNLEKCEPSFSENDKNECEKQAFFLNLFNFLILYHLAIQFLSSPESIEKLTDYNMWQSFLNSCSIKLGYHRLNAFTIFNSILRSTLSQPHITHFMLSTPAIEFQSNKYQVKNPNQFLCFGLYLPLKKMPHLKVFNAQDLEDDLRTIAQYYLEDRIKVREHYYYITLPKFMDWFSRDFNGNQLITLLEHLDREIMKKAGNQNISKILEKIRSKTINAYDFIVEYGAFSWEYKPLSMQEFFTDGQTGFLQTQN